MKIVFAIFLLIGASQALVCRENVCDTVRCKGVQSCDGRVDPTGGYCGCCPICVKQLDHKESCSSRNLLGVPATSECGKGLRCHPEAKTCEYDCEIRKASGKAVTNTFSRGYDGFEPPKCEPDGSYSPIQCLGSMCWCVDERGNGLHRGVHRWLTKGMDCNCELDKAAHIRKYGQMPGKEFRCLENGNYDRVQCAGSSCFCVNAKGQHIEGTSSMRRTDLQYMNCNCFRDRNDFAEKFGQEEAMKSFRCSDSGNYYYVQCEGDGCFCADEETGKQYEGVTRVSYRRSKSLGCACIIDKMAYYKEHGHVPGMMFRCTDIGDYERAQCEGSTCFCVDGGGVQFPGTSTFHISKLKDARCNCALDRDNAYAREYPGPQLGKIFRCTDHGNYEPIQCEGSQCFCVNKNGKQVEGSKSVHVSEMATLKC